MKRFALILPLLLVLGCAAPKTVGRAELERVKRQWQEPKVSTWYYIGSRNGFHHFYHQDLGDDQREFRISETELRWKDEFPLTRNRSNWRRLDWGVHDHSPLAVGDCLVLELEPEPNSISHALPWRRTIDAEGYYPAYVGIMVKIVGMTTTEARDAIASEYVRRNILRRPPGLVLMRCEEYDRKKMELK